MMFDATFSGIPVILWWPILLVEETGVYTLHIHCVSAPALHNANGYVFNFKDVLYNGITRPMWKIKADILSETVRV